MIRVLVADDDSMVCEHLQSILDSADDIEVIGVVHDGVTAITQAQQLCPDLVLMDVTMPGMDGLAATRRIAALDPPVRVVILTVLETSERVAQALQAGAAGFLVKAVRPRDLLNLVRVAAAGHPVLSTGALETLTALPTATDPDSARRLDTLTSRERQVAEQLGCGHSNAVIARHLFLTEATVKGHVSRILDKLGCENRAQAGLIARALIR